MNVESLWAIMETPEKNRSLVGTEVLLGMTILRVAVTAYLKDAPSRKYSAV